MKATDTAAAIRHLMGVLGVEGQSGRERAIADRIKSRLIEAGCSPAWIREDGAARRLGAGFTVGNLIVRIPGRIRAPRRLFLAHMDVVPLCRDARPVRRGDRIVARGHTALGADNRTSVAVLLHTVERLLRGKADHPPLTFLFTVAEETGLNGAKAVRFNDLGDPAMAFNFDGGAPAAVCVGAIGATRWTAQVTGVSAHAGAQPEDGVSAIVIAARAIERITARGFFGAVGEGRFRGTTNVGIIRGGDACNQVTDRVLVRGECRSHSRTFLRRLNAEYRRAFEASARSVRNRAGVCGKVAFEPADDYAAFRLPLSNAAVRYALAAIRRAGLDPATKIVDGGLDANPLNGRGLPTVSFGSGAHGAHSLDEYADIPEFLSACHVAWELATGLAPATSTPA